MATQSDFNFQKPGLKFWKSDSKAWRVFNLPISDFLKITWSDLYFLSFESFSTYCILKIQQRSTLMKRWSDFNFLFTNSSLIQWIHLALYFVIKLNLFLRISPPYFSVSYFRWEEMSVNQFKIIFKLFPEKDLNRKSNFLKSKLKWQVMKKFRNISSLGLIFLLLRPESLLYQKLGRPYWHLKSWKALTVNLFTICLMAPLSFQRFDY